MSGEEGEAVQAEGVMVMVSRAVVGVGVVPVGMLVVASLLDLCMLVSGVGDGDEDRLGRLEFLDPLAIFSGEGQVTRTHRAMGRWQHT